MNRRIFSIFILLGMGFSLSAQRSEILLTDGWEFCIADSDSWQKVSVPHDWAISGPFDIANDLQNVAVLQDGETVASLKTGRTGGLPYVGKGKYRTIFSVEEGKCAELLFDGVMNLPQVYVNGKFVGCWKNGYNAFHFDITKYLNSGDNLLEVEVENLPLSSRWYPGAGIFRNVHLITTSPVHIPVWGTYITTPKIEDDYAQVDCQVAVEGATGIIKIHTDIISPEGKVVTSNEYNGLVHERLNQHFIVNNPSLWSPESPALYKAITTLELDGKLVDSYETVFGIRSIEFIPYKGFFLNGELRKFKGVCNHHDLGPLGAAVNESAIKHRLALLKDMGCDAVRTSHNVPSPELVRLCDEMGLMVMVEAFDEWDVAKCTNGYHLYFNDWAEEDIVNMVRHFRNNPSVVLWSIGNEVPTQCSAQGYRVARYLQDICHREDPSRKVTCGMDRVDCILSNGFAAMIDIPGINYRTFRYKDVFNALPQGFVLGSETASTVSSRGVYKFPAVKRFSAIDADHHCSAYDLDACSWSNIPDIDFALADAYTWTLGQFVWTGFDYLGEPSPYSTNSWPNHSSMFGIIDLAGIPKDRFYLYRSVWNTDDHTLHILPHWNWEGHEGENIPVFVYTDSPSAELFLNGESLGVRSKEALPSDIEGLQTEELEQCYRLRWDVPYRKGELVAEAIAEDGSRVGRSTVRTAGKAHHLLLTPSKTTLKAGGEELCFITVEVVDKDDNLCPLDGSLLSFKVSGAAEFKASANGDPTCLDSFVEPRMHAFCGKLCLIIKPSKATGLAKIEVSGPSLAKATLKLEITE